MRKHALAVALVAAISAAGCTLTVEDQAIALAKADILKQARDPESVQFRNPIYSTTNLGAFVCIEANMANAVGGKTGYLRYVWSESSRSLAWDGRSADAAPMVRENEQRYIDRYCTD